MSALKTQVLILQTAELGLVVPSGLSVQFSIL